MLSAPIGKNKLSVLRVFLTIPKVEFTARQEDGGWLVHSHDENTRALIGGHKEALRTSLRSKRKSRQSQGFPG